MLSRRHYRWSFFRGSGHTSSIFLRPFAPPELPGFFATMVPLTPVGRLFVPTLRLSSIPRLPSRAMNTICLPAGLFASCDQPSDRSDSNHPSPPGTTRVCVFGSSSTTDQDFTLVHHVWRDTVALRFRLLIAGSPRRLAESSSLAFRTDRSPPVASHPASRRRSYGRLQDQTLTSSQGLTPRRFITLANAQSGGLRRPARLTALGTAADALRALRVSRGNLFSSRLTILPTHQRAFSESATNSKR